MLRTLALVFLLNFIVHSQSLAPGGPGHDAQWSTAAKQGIGTSANLESKVWFTLAQGVMTEVYYPDVTKANVQMLQFVVVNTKTKKVETERDDAVSQIESFPIQRDEKLIKLPSLTGVTISRPEREGDALKIPSIKLSELYRHVSLPNSLVFRQVNRSKIGSWSIGKTYLTDSRTNTVLMEVTFASDDPADELYVYYDPSLGNSGMGDSGWTDGRYLLSSDKNIASALTCGRCTMMDATNGFLGVNDGLKQLWENGTISNPFSRADNGNVVQTARIKQVSLNNGPSAMLFALAFATTPEFAKTAAAAALTKGFAKTYQEYQIGWLDYLKSLPRVDPKYQAQFNMAAMQLKAHEDKTHRGANIASLTVPWGGGANANENNVGGYHLVWSRDLYQVATAFMALGDRAAATRALDFLFNVQQ
ncbi:MAG: glycoside hydrolase family 15 protein, partial [Acidobacteriota bacterium]